MVEVEFKYVCASCGAEVPPGKSVRAVIGVDGMIRIVCCDLCSYREQKGWAKKQDSESTVSQS